VPEQHPHSRFGQLTPFSLSADFLFFKPRQVHLPQRERTWASKT
jgi:hypothetical protein